MAKKCWENKQERKPKFKSRPKRRRRHPRLCPSGAPKDEPRYRNRGYGLPVSRGALPGRAMGERPLPAQGVAFETRFEEATVAQEAAHTMSEKLKRNSPN